jgi:hypothetical protein
MVSAMARHPQRPRDQNQLAKLVVEIATGEAQDVPPSVSAEASVLGRLGGIKGGHARAARLSPSERSDIARAAAVARWSRRQPEDD